MYELKAILRSQLLRHEGIKLHPYTDTVGKLTIGIGRNLTDRGISKDEAFYLFNTDIEIALKDARRAVSNFDDISVCRQAVIVNMVFNLGLTRFLKFKKLRHAICLNDFPKASAEMLDSRWARQVGRRAEELSELMLDG